MKLLVITALFALVSGCALIDALTDSDDGNIVDPPEVDASIPLIDGSPRSICQSTRFIGVLDDMGGLQVSNLDPCDDPERLDLSFLAACGSEGLGVGMILEVQVNATVGVDVEVCVNSMSSGGQLWSVEQTSCREMVSGECLGSDGSVNCVQTTLFGPSATIYWEAVAPSECPLVDVSIMPINLPPPT